MKMVASSKLHRAQQAIGSMYPYKRQLDKIMSTFSASLEGELTSPYSVAREVKRVALVVYTSNSSLCGGFNGNVIKLLRKKIETYQKQNIEVPQIYPIGKKAYEAARKMGFKDCSDYAQLLDHPNYAQAAELAGLLMTSFTSGAFDRIEMIYHHFKSAGSQILTEETFLPIKLDAPAPAEVEKNNDIVLNYIVEPSAEAIMESLIPKALHLKVFTALLDSLASEHGARVIAMQVATDNADELLRQLTLTYNKTRQQAITAELLDIVGGSMQ